MQELLECGSIHDSVLHWPAAVNNELECGFARRRSLLLASGDLLLGLTFRARSLRLRLRGSLGGGLTRLLSSRRLRCGLLTRLTNKKSEDMASTAKIVYAMNVELSHEAAQKQKKIKTPLSSLSVMQTTKGGAINVHDIAVH